MRREEEYSRREGERMKGQNYLYGVTSISILQDLGRSIKLAMP